MKEKGYKNSTPICVHTHTGTGNGYYDWTRMHVLMKQDYLLAKGLCGV
jgi:hypothetical protein